MAACKALEEIGMNKYRIATENMTRLLSFLEERDLLPAIVFSYSKSHCNKMMDMLVTKLNKVKRSTWKGRVS